MEKSYPSTSSGTSQASRTTYPRTMPTLPEGSASAPHQASPRSEEPPGGFGDERNQRKIIFAGVVAAVLLIAACGLSTWWLAQPSTETGRVRDIFIIFMALESLLIGATLVVLMIQMARLINLLQNEIKPILDSTNETVSNLRGTTMFLSDNLVEPVIKMNEYLAGFTQFFQVLGLVRKPRQPRPPKGE